MRVELLRLHLRIEETVIGSGGNEMVQSVGRVCAAKGDGTHAADWGSNCGDYENSKDRNSWSRKYGSKLKQLWLVSVVWSRQLRAGKWFMVILGYPAAILQDAQAMMISDLVKGVDYMEVEGLRGKNGHVMTVRLGKVEYPATIQQDFQAGENEASSKEEEPKFDERLGGSPMEALLKGMSQLHQAMTLQLDRQSNKPEAIRPGITGSELPKLPEADEYAAINVGDWLHGLTGPMGDLTDGSGGWWTDVTQSLDDYYKEYLAATTVRKVQLKAEDFARPGVREERWARVDKRAASMLLQAVPEAIKSELMANRLSTTLAILGRVGGSPMDLVEILRKWARWLKRAEDLGLQPPDASILLKGLDVATKPLMEKNNEILFRTNMLRFSLDLDAAPTKTAVLRFHGHLLAEFEQLAYRGRGKGGPAASAAVRAANATGDAGTSPTSTQKGGSSPSASASARPCKFFAQESGCQRLNCEFAHDWANIPKEEKSERCKNCGAKGHMKRQCPLRASSDGGRKGEEGKGTAVPKVRATTASTNKGADGKRDDGTAPGGEAPQSSSTTSAATTASTAEAGVSAASMASGARGSAGEIDDFLKNATQILKMMTEKQGAQQAQGPSMKMLKKAVRRFENRLALVDSGATHPLREARPDEWAEAPEVDVVIAGDGVTTMRQNTAGTLLTEPQGHGRRPQTIVPVGNLIGLLGYELIWSKKKCVLRSPDGREEVLKMTSGCPEVNEALALDLIAKIEQEKLTRLEKAMEESKRTLVRAMKVEKDPSWEKNLKKFVETGKFEDGYCAISSMPWATDVMNEDLVRTISDIPQTEKEAWNLMMALGFNRRMRKRMMHKDWIVRFYSGKRSYVDKMFKMFENNGTMVLDIDVMRWTQLDMLNTNKGIMTLLLWGAATGRIAGTFAAVPKSNTFEHTLRVVVINEVAKAGRRIMCEAADVPEDGVAVCMWASSQAEEDESSTVWLHKWFRQWVAHSFLDVMHFDQGAFGHALRRVAGPKYEKFAVVFTYQFPKLKMMPEDQSIDEDELGGWDLDAKVREEAGGIGEFEVDVNGEAIDEYELSLDEAEEVVKERVGKATEDWWEFREAEGILVRHHVVSRLRLFRPTKANGCPVPPTKLEPTRITEVKYIDGGAEMETSDWHGYQSGARSLDRMWTGTTTFKISQAEVTEEEEVLDKDEKSWEALIGDLTKPVEMETIYTVYPVRNRRGGDVMLAVQEAVLIRVRFKGVEEANVSMKYWTLAMQHASNRQIYYKLGLSKPPLLPFGTTVMIRRKVFGNNKKYDLTDRWEQGTYLGLSDTIKGGAIVLRPTGILTETLNLRAGVVDPRRLLQDPAENEGEEVTKEEDKAIIDLPEPDHRLTGKQRPPELRVLRLGDEDEYTSVLEDEEWSVMTILERQEWKAREFYEKGAFDLQACGEVLQELNVDGKMRTQGRGTQTTSMILGAYVHGGLRGVSAQGMKRPWLTRYLNAVLKTKVKEDLGEDGGGYARDLQQELPGERIVNGTLFNINQKAIAFDPKGEHAYLKPEVERWVVVGFTPLGVEKLLSTPRSVLGRCGFPLEGTGVEVSLDLNDEEELPSEWWQVFSPEENMYEEELVQRAKVLRCVLQEEVEDASYNPLSRSEYVQQLEYAREVCERDLQEFDGQVLRRIAKISPGEAKDYEVEPLLQSLQAPLEVVHNVSLQEVRKNVSKWVASIRKEVDALIGSGTIKPLSPEQTRELKACGLKVLPGKAVFTAKPPSDSANGEWFRRKCRVVVCGNFLPHSRDNVYASGTSADTLRVSLAYAILQKWTAGCTDISNAFTLTPMPDNLMYGVTPPSIVVLAGAAQPGETWKIERVLYGLREAPRLWSLFRNDRLLSARIEYEGRVLLLRNLDTDENLWRVCYEDRPEETEGLMLIYVDDILVLSVPGIIKCCKEEAFTFRKPDMYVIYYDSMELRNNLEATVRMAQKVTGEALWLSTRIMQYLSKTADYGLLYQAGAEALDVSWHRSAELYEGVAAVQLGLGVAAMVTELCENPVMHLRIDNSAAQGLASEAPGTWKTRHLRVRARFLRQEVAAQRLVISHVPGALQKADLGTKGFDLPKFKELVCLWGIIPFSAETSRVALRTLRATTTGGVLLFVILCLMLVRGAEGAKDDLPLDGSIEFYGMMMVCILAAVAVWEGLKKCCGFLHGQWTGCQKRKKKLERLRNRAQAAVQEEIHRHTAPTSPLSGAASSTGPTSRAISTPPRATRAISPRISGSSLRSRRSAATASTATASLGVEKATRGTQTDGMMFGPERLRGFEGPYFITPHGDRVHLSAGCHGQRNAGNPARAYRVCQYCVCCEALEQGGIRTDWLKMKKGRRVAA
ncbi:RE1 [Symbiodinium sp. KB8]|nr:RE1 [Symbiodinium sp. KB8]